MSANLVKKMLRAVDTLDSPVPESSPKKKRKRKDVVRTVATKNDIVRSHISQVLALDRAFAGGSASTVKQMRTVEGVKGSAKRRKTEAKGAIVTNSRSSAHVNQVNEPTFNKKKHAQRKKARSLAKVAKLLAGIKEKKKR